MSIKFICSCGKHLRARDEMAARRSMCPRCGAPVGVPSLRPTHAGTPAAPMTPQERRRRNRDKPNNPEAASGDWRTGSVSCRVESTSHPAAHAAGSPVKGPPRPTPKPRRRRQLERYWHQCLAYPLLNWKMLLCLSVISSVWMSGVVLAVPEMPSFSLKSLQNGAPWACGVLVLVLIAAYTFVTVEWALTSALAGEGPAFYRPGWRAAFPLKSGVRWLVCFFAGPIVPAGIAVYYWMYGGDLTALDWAIVAELGMAAAGYWFLTIVSANERNRLRDANPQRVAELVRRLKHRAVVPVLIAPALAVAHLLQGLLALATLHERTFAGWLLLLCCWCSALFWSAFFFRLMGVWCYRIPPAGPASQPQA